MDRGQIQQLGSTSCAIDFTLAKFQDFQQVLSLVFFPSSDRACLAQGLGFFGSKGRQGQGLNQFTFTENHASLNDVLQLTDIAGPMIRHHFLHGLFGKTFYFLTNFFACIFSEN
ncbi:MAG: hypothetical protein HC831_16205, partial [Chloroflexia bacterium]|nr:hypothetical protein [Chloroflexia bacterium]